MRKKRTLHGLTEWGDIEKELLKDPDFRKESELLEPEFKLMRQMIDIRLKEKISQKELARRMGTKQSAISRMESGQISSTLYYLSKLARALGKKLVIDFK